MSHLYYRCFIWAFSIIIPAANEPAALSDREGVPVIDWKDADKHLNERVFVQGTIVATRNIGTICFLNFDKSKDRSFTAIIRKANFDKFPEKPEIAYLNKNVRILGTITEYQGKPQIVVASPQQIEVLDELAPIASTSPTSQPIAKPSDRITIATFNTLNLFDNHDDPYHEDEGTPAKPREELEHLAATIRQVNADVIALEEVENRGYLERFNKAMLADMGYVHVVHYEGNDLRGIDCAVLSRFPVGTVTSYRHITFRDAQGRTRRFERDLLRVEIKPTGGKEFDLFAIHLKSKGSGPESDVQREAEATAIRGILDDLHKQNAETRFVICGDFNDTWDSKSLEIIRGSGEKELKTFFEEIPTGERITYNEEPHRSMIDFLLCSPAMARTYIPGSFKIYPGSPKETGSDHNPVASQFRLK